MKSFKQRDRTDCGAACFAWICDHHGLRLPIARLRSELGTDRAGTNAAAMVQAAHRLGFTAKGVKGPPDALPSVPLPAIAHCLVDGRLLHYVVLVEWRRGHARVMDPAVGRIEKWPHEKFKAAWTGVLILLAPGERFEAGDRTVSPWRRLWTLLRPHRSVVLQSLLGAIVTTVLGLGMSVYVQKIVDHVIPDGNRPLLNLLGVAMLVVLGFRLLLGWSQSLMSLRLAQKIDAALILAYYRHLLRLPQPFFDTMRVGEIASRVADAVKIRSFLNQTLLNLVLNPLILLLSLGAMFLWSWKLAALSLLLLPVNAGIYWIVNRLNREYQRRAMERAADFEAQLVESLAAQPVLRSCRLEDHATLKTEARLVRLLKTTWTAAWGGAATNSAATLVTQAYLVGLLWLGAGLVLEAGLTPGQLMSCYTLASYLASPVLALIGANASIQEALIATDRLFEVMDLELEADRGGIELDAAGAGDIRFERVAFKHAGRSATLQDIMLTLPRGAISVLVGDSGCGKSTLLALVQRLYEPQAGRILIGDHDIRYHTLASLRRNLAVVHQQPQLLSGTILENLAPGEFQPDLRRLVALCRDIGIAEFIESLPQGFLTPLSENGAGLSGGQRQRLALVRALYQDAPILLLDEPTSALDAGSESRLLELLRRLRAEGRTIVVATHTARLPAAADLVVTLADGRIVSTRQPDGHSRPREGTAEFAGVA
jgi:ABC-type bacteriocin/lantibiotic exporter with double-glycine peptidase domain